MKTIIIRPSVDNQYSDKARELEEAFDEMSLIDKTICQDRVIYVFGDKIKLSQPNN